MAYQILKPERAKEIKGVLLDMDGVVLDSETLYTRFWREAAAHFGYEMSQEQALGLRSANAILGQKHLESCFGKGVDYGKMRKARIEKMDAYIAQNGVAAKKGIFELLDLLKTLKIPCAIATSSPLERAKAHLSPLGLYEKFDRICSVYEVERGKPYPDIYLYGAKCLGVPIQNCLALEDSPTGLQSAVRADSMAIFVSDQDEANTYVLEHAFAKTESLLDVCALIQAQMAKE